MTSPGPRSRRAAGNPRRRQAGRGASLAVPLAAIPLLAFGLLAGCEVASTDDEDVIEVQTAPAEVRDMRITAEATGQLEPVLTVEVKSKASGEILDLFVDSGDGVEPGALLARVDPRDVQNAFDQAEADLNVAQARMEVAEDQQARSQELLESEVITAQEFEGSKLEYANAQAALVRAETNLELATLRLTDVTILAPMAGTILEKQVEVGQVIQSATQNVSGGTPLFIMANLDNMRVRTLVDETDVGQLSSGMTATVTVEAFPDRTFQGEIEKIEPQAVVEQNVTMFPVIVLLDNRAGILKPGMNAEVEVLVDERLSALTVPNNAVVQPQEVAPAAEVLGLDPQSVAVDRGAWGDLMAQAARTLGAGAGPGQMAGAGGRGDAATSGPGGEESDWRGRMAELRAGVESGEISQDSMRALMASMRGGGAGGGQGFSAPAGGAGSDRSRPGFGPGMMAAMGGSTGDPAFTPAVAFVVDVATGAIEARPVVMGVTDWDYAEILAGLEEGEELALIGAAQLQARQQERMEQMRGRFRPF